MIKNNLNIVNEAIKQTIFLFALLFISYQVKHFSEIIYTIISLIIILFQTIIPQKIITKYNQNINDYNLHAHGLENIFDQNNKLINYTKLKKEFIHLLIIILPLFSIYIFLYIKYFNLRFNFNLPPSWSLEIFIQIFVVAMPEEIFYRGFLQNALLKRFSIFKSIFITNIFFAISHLFAGFNVMRILTFFPGLIFSYLAYKNKSLFSAILFHALCNLLGQFLWYSTK